mgnify:CR=1 FL=1
MRQPYALDCGRRRRFFFRLHTDTQVLLYGGLLGSLPGLLACALLSPIFIIKSALPMRFPVRWRLSDWEDSSG